MGGASYKKTGVFSSSLRAFAPEDYAEICKWYAGHNQTAPAKQWLPNNGRIVPEVAAGFLYRTDSNVGFLDAFVANPAASGRAIREALEMILLSLEADAKNAGLTAIFGTTRFFSIAKIAKKLGGVADENRYFAMAKVL